MKPTTRFLALFLVLASTAGVRAQQFRVISSNTWISGVNGFNYLTGAMPIGEVTTWPLMRAWYGSSVPRGRIGILGLQEVYHWNSRPGRDPNVARDVASALGLGWSHRFGAARPANNGEYGNAVVTNAAILDTQHWVFAHDPNNTTDYGSERRAAVAVKLDFGNRRQLWFVNTHLDWKRDVPVRQVWQMMGRVKTFDPDYPVIVVGDMNIESSGGRGGTDYAMMAAIFQIAGFQDVSAGKDTIIRKPTPVVDGQIDYIFLYDPHSRVTVDRCWTRYVFSYPLILSDHMAVVADLHWN